MIYDVCNIISQIVATSLFAALMVYLYKWGKRDKKKRTEKKLQKQRELWAAEIERAGRAMIEEDERQRVLKSNVKEPEVELRGNFHSIKFDGNKIRTVDSDTGICYTL